jgi:peroxiredoxin
LRTRFIALAALTVAVGCRNATSSVPQATVPTAPTVVVPGERATDFTARDIDGKTVRLRDFLGKNVVLLDFYTTFCEPCVAELPHLRRIYEQSKDKGFVVLAIAMDGPETIANVRGFVQRNNLEFPMLVDQDSRITAAYNPNKTAPFLVLIDGNGTVALTRVGYNPGDEEPLAKEIAKLLPPASTR